MRHRYGGGLAWIVGVALLATTLSGCALFADEQQKEAVQANMQALPQDVSDALHLGKVRLHPAGPTGTDVSADRKVHLTTGRQLPTTAGRWVAYCRAGVRALAPTSGRLYGWNSSGGRRAHEETDETCLRGIGLSTQSWWIGLPQVDGRVLDTAVDLSIFSNAVYTHGTSKRTRGDAIPVAKVDVAELDRAMHPATVPWRLPPSTTLRRGDVDTVQLTFVVPAGTHLRVSATCGERVSDKEMSLGQASDSGSVLSFIFGDGKPKSADPDDSQTASCTGTLVAPLRPRFSYRSVTAGQVDQYDLRIALNSRVSSDGRYHDPSVLVERVP